MKKMMLFLAAVLMMGTAQAKTVKKVIKVSGECEMCEQRIETAAKSVKGVISANWNVKSKKMAIVFDDKQTSLKAIEAKIAAAGHDTQDVKATTKAYNSLPGCCKYRSTGKKQHGSC